MLLLILGLLSLTLLVRLLRRQKRRFNWADQVVLITGGSNGIGKALCEELLRRGCLVVVLDIKEPLQTHKRLHYEACDVSKADAVTATAAQLKSKRLLPTIIINNAGLFNGKFLLELSNEEICSVINVNLMAPFWVVKAFLPEMISQPFGHVVNISSCLGLGGVAKMTDYCASKFGLYGFNESLRLELKALGHGHIKTTVVCPFLVLGGMFKEVSIRFPMLTRPLTTDTLSDRIVRAIEDGSEELWLPTFVKGMPLLRMIPASWYDGIQKVAITSWFMSCNL